MSKSFEPLWTQTLQNPIRGVSLARETDAFIAWDSGNWLYHLNHAGQRQAQVRLDSQIVQAAIADDGSALAVLSADGLHWLGPDLATLRQQPLVQAPLSLAVDAFGQYAAVADSRNRVYVFNRLGQQVTQVAAPRAFHHLAFVPTAPLIIGCADYGLIGCLNLHGDMVWRHGLVAHTGSLAVTGDGRSVQVACFSEGLQRYDLQGKDLGRLKLADSCRLMATAFDGHVSLVAGRAETMALVDENGRELGSFRAEQPIAALALSALGDYALVGDARGSIIKLAVHHRSIDV